jgi:hypothetical protein
VFDHGAANHSDLQRRRCAVALLSNPVQRIDGDTAANWKKWYPGCCMPHALKSSLHPHLLS